MVRSSNGGGEKSAPKATTARRRAVKVPEAGPAEAPDKGRASRARRASTLADPVGGPSLEDIQQRAYEIYLQRGGGHGRDVEDWLEAERQLGAGRAPARA